MADGVGVDRDARPAGDPSRAALLGLGAALCALGFWAMGGLYGGFEIPYGLGVQQIHPAELVVWIWYLLFGIAGVALGAAALLATALPGRALAALRRLGARPAAVGLAAVAVIGIVFAARASVLRFAPVADDESTYVFIARTLLEGRLVNPAPEDAAFFRNQFVILDGERWYGKYPIGHPLVLAVGEALHLRALVPSILSALTLLLSFAVGRRVLPAQQALLGTGLLLVSPQFLLTGATELSQLTSGLCLLLGLWALLRMDDGGSLGHAALAGAALGFGALARPLPGVLFIATAGIWVLIRYQDEPAARQARRLVAGLAPMAFCGLVLLATQLAQTSELGKSSYDVYHGGAYRGFFRGDWIAGSLGGALLRQNFWLFGWPISFLFLPFARRHGRAGLLWAMVIALYSYRVILPKTVVASTGPVYVAEAVPLLALLSASGAANAAGRLAAFGLARERAQAAVAAVAMASVAFAALTFAPLQVRELRRSGGAWQTANRLLDEAGAHHALVFADRMVDGAAPASWAYFPPNPSPDLTDPRIFVRIPHGEDGPQRARAFWQRRFPDRSAWVFVYHEGEPRLHRLGG